MLGSEASCPIALKVSPLKIAFFSFLTLFFRASREADETEDAASDKVLVEIKRKITKHKRKPGNAEVALEVTGMGEADVVLLDSLI